MCCWNQRRSWVYSVRMKSSKHTRLTMTRSPWSLPSPTSSLWSVLAREAQPASTSSEGKKMARCMHWSKLTRTTLLSSNGCSRYWGKRKSCLKSLTTIPLLLCCMLPSNPKGIWTSLSSTTLEVSYSCTSRGEGSHNTKPNYIFQKFYWLFSICTKIELSIEILR